MSRERLELLKLLWPAGAVALAFGMVHCVLLCLLGEALEAGADIDLSLYWGGGGVALLPKLSLAGVGNHPAPRA